MTRGPSPREDDFPDYRDAFPFLLGRLGPYCSYCERRMPTNLAVEHIQPKGRPEYAHLIGAWDNYLLGCVNCNGTKGDRDVRLDELVLPDRDNSYAAFEYRDDGSVHAAAGLSPGAAAMAAGALALCGLDRRPENLVDENDRIVASDRVAQRREVTALARMLRGMLPDPVPDGTVRYLVATAAGYGHFSIWMDAFGDVPEVRRGLLDGFVTSEGFVGFPGTALECFPATGGSLSPRPANGLAHGGKC